MRSDRPRVLNKETSRMALNAEVVVEMAVGGDIV
jgi:hypothetical protein